MKKRLVWYDPLRTTNSPDRQTGHGYGLPGPSRSPLTHRVASVGG